MRIELACTVCGSNNFELAEAEDDAAVVSCGDCGHRIGTLGELKSKLAGEVLRRSRGGKSGSIPAPAR